MMTTPAAFHRYYNSVWRSSPSPYRLLFSSQFKAFSHYQSQQYVHQVQQLWQKSKRSSSMTYAISMSAFLCPYIQQLFCQTFMSQRQYHPLSTQQRPQVLLPATADCNYQLTDALIILSVLYYICVPGNSLNYNPPCQLANNYQVVPCQSYLLRQSQYVYQLAKEKERYQIDDKPSLEVDEDLLKGKAYYINDTYDKLQVNFIRIDLICNQCTATFLTQSALYKHIKAGCIPS